MKHTKSKSTWTKTLQSVATDFADGKFNVYVGRKDEQVDDFNKLIVRASKNLSSAKRRETFIGILMSTYHQRHKYGFVRLSKLQMNFLETIAKN